MSSTARKVVVIGETATGKTSVIRRFVHEEFKESHYPDGMPSVASKKVGDCKLAIWDTSGAEQWQQMNKDAHHGAEAIVFLSAFDNEASLDKLVDHWVKVLSDSIDLSKCVKVLAVNKCDLDESDRQISGNAKIEETARRLGVVQHGTFICSAKTNENITELFDCVARELQRAQAQNAGAPQPVALDGGNQGQPEQKGGCC